jgi:Rrf2 family transcriptional regulator, nitric oxide-sensitive transcriptional repressor
MAKLINISEAASLAVYGMILIAKNKPLRMNIKELSEKLQASPTHLAKVFQKLSKAGLVRSLRGPAGGFELYKEADEISVLDIYEVIDGKLTVNGCPFDKDFCAFQACIFNSEMNHISTEIYELFKNLKLSEY